MKCPNCQENISFVKETNQGICYHCGHTQPHTGGHTQPHTAEPKRKPTKQDKDLAVIAYKKFIFVLGKTFLRGFYNLFAQPLTSISIKEAFKSAFCLLGSIYLLGLGYQWYQEAAFQAECGQYIGELNSLDCQIAKNGNKELTNRDIKNCTCNGINPYL